MDTRVKNKDGSTDYKNLTNCTSKHCEDEFHQTAESSHEKQVAAFHGQLSEKEEDFNSNENSFFYLETPSNFTMESCLATFDRDGDGCLNYTEFTVLCRALFRNDRDKAYHIDGKMIKNMFNIFDYDQDGIIDEEEFETCWQKWVKKIVRPVSVLVVVDVQNDFITGSLAVSNCPAKQNGEEVVEPINRLLDSVEFDGVFYSLDWHPSNHVSFIDNVSLRKFHESSEIQDPNDAGLYDLVVFEGPPLTRQRLWPRHCVQNSWGAKLHENLKVVEGSPFIYKGTNPDIDSYSAFWDNSKLSQTSLISEIQKKGATDVYVCGLAYDVCVGATALHALEHGYRTMLIDDLCRGITLEDIQSTKDNITGGYGLIVESHQVQSMVQGRDRRPELGYKLAVDIKKEREA